MPDFGSATFSQTDSSNASGTMPSWSGAAAPSTLDDAGRALQGAVTREWNWRSYTLTAGGTSDAKTLTFSVAPAAYYNGQRFAFIANTTNTTTATLNVNSLGAKTIKKDVSGTLTNLTASEMVSGMFIEVAYNTANDCFVWVNRGIDAFPAGSVSAPSITTNGDTNTGFWFPAADTIAASTGGSERLRVDNGGNVGIGVTPTAKLHVLDLFDGNKTICSFNNISNVSTATAASIDLVADQSWVRFTTTRDGAGTSAALTISPTVAGTPTDRLRIDTSGNILNVSSGGLGYGTGSGGTIGQTGSRTTGVALNKTNGSITLFNAPNSTTFRTFTVTNSTVAATDVILLSQRSGVDRQQLLVTNVAAGSFDIAHATTTGTTTEAPIINFAVIKAVTS